MTPTEVVYGVRYSDDSGWERQVSMDARTEKVWLEVYAERLCMTFEEMDWVLRALLTGREVLAMDKLERGPVPSGEGGQ